MKIAYVTIKNPLDMHYSSGTPYHIYKAFKDKGFQIDSIQTEVETEYDNCNSFFYRFKNAYVDNTLYDKAKYRLKETYYRKIARKTYFRQHEPSYMLRQAAYAEKKIANSDYDIAFAWSAQATAYLNIDKPLFFWSDSTFSGLIDIYQPYADLCSESKKLGLRVDKMALSKCRLAIYSSEWAAKTAIERYNVDPSKVKVVPFGANLSCNRSVQDIKKILDHKKFDTCKLLFLGTHWQPKGGEKALAVARRLNQGGLKTELHVAGCTPPVNLPKFVISYGYLSKTNEQERNILDKLYSESHFLILPSRYDCFGIVFAEASSFGLPSLATKVGGIPSAIKDGKNGQTFSLEDDADKYCYYVESLMANRENYLKLSLSSFNEYMTRLNWSTSIQKVQDYIQETCL